VFSDSHAAYKEFASGKEDIISGIFSVTLLIYRNLIRNPHPQILRELQMVGMGTSIKAND
jgi:hypothetical protein